LPILLKAIGSGLAVAPNAVGSDCQVRPKTLPKGATMLGPAAQEDPIVLGLAQNTSKRSWVWLPARPTDLRVWLCSYTQ